MAKQTFSVGQVLTAAQMTSLQQTAMLGGSATAKTTSYTLVAADAGTVVSVNSTSATTITVNTGIFSAGDIVTIQNWGSGSTTITAGTATVNTAGSLIVPQYDGGVLYFTSASAAIYFDFVQAGAVSPLTTKGDIWVYGSSDTRLAVGSNDQVLTADSSTATGLKWAAAGGGGMTLLSTTTLSGSSTTVSGISGSYKNLYILIVGINTASNSVVTLKPNGSSNIVDSAFIQCINGVQDSVLSKYSNNLLISGDAISVNATTTTNIFTIEIFDYANASFQKLANYSSGLVRNASQETQIFGNGRIKTTSAISSFEITSGTGNFNGGTIYTYGVN